MTNNEYFYGLSAREFNAGYIRLKQIRETYDIGLTFDFIY